MPKANLQYLSETRLIKMLLGFSKADLKQFADFVKSPYFNKNEHLVRLYTFILKYAPHFKHPKFTFEAAFHYLFPDQTYKKEAIIKLCSKLMKLAEKFVIQQQMNDKELKSKLVLLTYYNKANQNDLFESLLKNTRKLNEGGGLRNSQYYKLLFEMESEYAHFLSAKLDDRKGDVNFQATTHSLDVYYLSQKLEQLCQMKNRQQTVSFPYRFDLMEEIMSFLPQSIYYEIPIIQIWYTAFLLLHQPTIAHYQGLKKLIQQHHQLVAIQEKRVLYTYLENSSAQLMGRVERYVELFDLYQLQLQDQTLYSNGYLQPTIFRNIITVALKLKENDWAEQFLKDQQALIMPDYVEKEDMVSFCKALILFEQEKYEEALDFLNLLKYNNVYTKLDERRVRLKVYYELEFEDPFDDLINSFRKFISKNKAQINEVYIDLNRNFINAINAIRKLTYEIENQEIKRNELVAEIKEIQLIAEKDWLLEKLEA